MGCETSRDWVIQAGVLFSYAFRSLNPDRTPKNLTGYSARVQLIPDVGTAHDYPLAAPTAESPSVIPARFDFKLLPTVSATLTGEIGTAIYERTNPSGIVDLRTSRRYMVEADLTP